MKSSIFDLQQLAAAVGRNVDGFRTLLSEETRNEMPRPDGKASGSWYWLRSNVDDRKWRQANAVEEPELKGRRLRLDPSG
jgi:hypothetical protein